MSLRSYNFRDSDALSSLGSRELQTWLQQQGWAVRDVSKDRVLQHQGIDLIAQREGRQRCIEVKVDCKASTYGNFFLETHSNVGKGTRGCFLYTQSDYLFYYLPDLDPPKLYRLPTARLQRWVRDQLIDDPQAFEYTETQTEGKYKTGGYKVPIQRVLEEVQGAKHLQIPSRIVERTPKQEQLIQQRVPGSGRAQPARQKR